MPRFFTEGRLQSFERMMQQTPGRTPKSGGKQRGNTRTVEDADCHCEAPECARTDERTKAGIPTKPQASGGAL